MILTTAMNQRVRFCEGGGTTAENAPSRDRTPISGAGGVSLRVSLLCWKTPSLGYPSRHAAYKESSSLSRKTTILDMKNGTTTKDLYGINHPIIP